MIKNIKGGAYKLTETKNNVKILDLDGVTYAWIEPSTGEILVYSHKPHRTDCLLAIGHYELYDVVDEPALSDQLHLELEVGRACWQGYLLPTGLPNSEKNRSLIIPTIEIITGNPRFNKHAILLTSKSI